MYTHIYNIPYILVTFYVIYYLYKRIIAPYLQTHTQLIHVVLYFI